MDCSELFVGMDVSKDRHAVAVAEGGRDGEVISRYSRTAINCLILASGALTRPSP